MALLRFNHILGQEKAKKILTRSFQRDKVSHAYLFRGPVGVGKKTLAQSFAAFLNCHGRRGDEFCGECSSCRKFASGNHPDYLDLSPENGTLKIDQIRQLKKKLRFPPFEAKYRVVVLPDIHQTMLRKEVSNSLLKTLEEPPAQTVIILTADESGAVLSTILSRCHVVLFNGIPLPDISGWLTANREIAEAEAKTLAALSGGSLGRAMKLGDSDMLAVRRELLETIHLLQPTEGITIEKIMTLASQVAELKDDIPEFFDLIRSWLRDILLICFGGEMTLLNNQDLLHLYRDVTDRWSITELFTKLDDVNLARKQLKHNCNRVSVCEMLFWKLI